MLALITWIFRIIVVTFAQLIFYSSKLFIMIEIFKIIISAAVKTSSPALRNLLVDFLISLFVNSGQIATEEKDNNPS